MCDGRANPPLADAVSVAAGRRDVAEALEAVYHELAERTAARRPRCDRSGRCCRFEEFGHRLYVTTIELSGFVQGLRDMPVNPRVAWDGSGCPFQKDGLCSVHEIRPFGCRLFYCDPTSTEWQEQTYRALHERLRALHDSLDVPYFYVEWREALKRLGLAVLQEVTALTGDCRRTVVSAPAGVSASTSGSLPAGVSGSMSESAPLGLSVQPSGSEPSDACASTDAGVPSARGNVGESRSLPVLSRRYQ